MGKPVAYLFSSKPLPHVTWTVWVPYAAIMCCRRGGLWEGRGARQQWIKALNKTTFTFYTEECGDLCPLRRLPQVSIFKLQTNEIQFELVSVR